MFEYRNFNSFGSPIDDDLIRGEELCADTVAISEPQSIKMLMLAMCDRDRVTSIGVY